MKTQTQHLYSAISSAMKDDMMPWGVKLHFIIAASSLAMFLLLAIIVPSMNIITTVNYSSKSVLSLSFVLWGLVYDNLAVGLGKYIGEGPLLRRITTGRFMLHGFGIPVMAIPMTQIATYYGIYQPRTETMIQMALLTYSSVEVIRWAMHNAQLFKLVDNRTSKTHTSAHLSGTLSYMSDAIVEIVLPCVLLVLYQIVISLMILFFWKSSSSSSSSSPNAAAMVLLVSAIGTLLSTAIKGRPDIQLWGELFQVCTVWGSLFLLK